MARATTTDATSTDLYCPTCPICYTEQTITALGYDSEFATGTSSDYIYMSTILALGIFLIILIDFLRHLSVKTFQ